MTRRVLPSLAMVVLLAPGCAYQVYVLGSDEPGAPAPLGKAITLAITDHQPEEDDPELRRELAAKIERLLTAQGYRLVPVEQAEALLFFRYNRESTFGKVVMESTPGATGGIHAVHVEPPYNHSLVLRVVDGQDYREQQTQVSYWSGEAVLNHTQVGGTKVLDMLLVALFDHFAEDTGTEVKVSLGIENRRARELRQP